MKALDRLCLVAALTTLMAGVAVQTAEGQAKKKASTVKYYSVPAGKVLRVRMEDSISSKDSHPGQTFHATTVDPVYSSNGVMLIPAGSTVNGRVTNAIKAQKNGKPGMIDVTFTSINLPNHRHAAITGLLTSLEEGKVSSNDEGTVSAKKTSHRNIKFIGGGAGGGLLIGAIAGGGKGAAIGAGVGAVGGFITKKLVKGSEAEVKPGTEFGVYLSRAVSLPRYGPTTP